VTQWVVLAGLMGACIWDLLTWLWGLPTSSSHALIGAYAGAAIVRAGLVSGWGNCFSVIIASGWTKTLLFIVLAPIMGLVMGFTFMVATYWIFRRRSPMQVDTLFRKLQLLSAASYSLGHGGNDAQKTMGIIAVLLYSQGLLGKSFPSTTNFPLWIVLSCHAAMGLGTMAGGWRIVKTMGMRLTKLRPFGGFCAETGGSLAIFIATQLGIPVSTTHTITGAIVGVGSVSNPGRVRWGLASRILWAWVFTIPASALVAAITYFIARGLGA